MRKCNKILDRLGATDLLFVEKPARMHRRTFERLLVAARNAESSVDTA
jgi:hypothetical protein